MPALNSLASQSFDGSSSYGDKVHFVHIYVPEPHPREPDISPYRGSPWPAEFSSVAQALTYPERVANAEQMGDVGADQLLLIDELSGGNTNPVWCTYGTCPNCSFLIGQDGNVAAVNTWVNSTDLKRDIDALLGP